MFLFCLSYTLLADDVLKARLKTVGVAEYIFELETAAGRDSGTEWRIIDVGGSRSQVCLIIIVHTIILVLTDALQRRNLFFIIIVYH